MSVQGFNKAGKAVRDMPTIIAYHLPSVPAGYSELEAVWSDYESSNVRAMSCASYVTSKVHGSEHRRVQAYRLQSLASNVLATASIPGLLRVAFAMPSYTKARCLY